MTHVDLAAHAQAIIDANLYLTLGTADPDGRPWTSPVFFAAGSDGQYYWISAADGPRWRRDAAGAAVRCGPAAGTRSATIRWRSGGRGGGGRRAVPASVRPRRVARPARCRGRAWTLRAAAPMCGRIPVIRIAGPRRG